MTERTEHLGGATIVWNEDTLVRVEIAGAIVHGEVITDPLLGAAHRIEHARATGDPLRATTMSALDWTRPTRIPAIAAPGLLPRGAAAPLLNLIALLAQRAGVPALRYAGPYPTPALFRSLRRSFRTTATEDDFTADLLGRAARLARDEIAIDFVPAPHERALIPGGHVEVRDDVSSTLEDSRECLERVVIDGISYERDGSPGRLVSRPSADPRSTGHPTEVNAEIWFGDQPYAQVAVFTPAGALLRGPTPIPPCTSSVIGKEFPPALRAAIAELVADSVPAPLAPAARRILISHELRWADLGGRAAVHDPTGFTVHAALWDRIAPFGLGRVAFALTEALTPIVVGAVLADVALMSEPGPPDGIMGS